MRTDAELIELHKQMRKEAFAAALPVVTNFLRDDTKTASLKDAGAVALFNHRRLG